MWQEIIVGIIGIAVVYYIARKIYYRIISPKETTNPCCGCSGGCSLKDETQKNKACKGKPEAGIDKSGNQNR